MPIDIKNISNTGYSERENSDAINQIIQFGSSGVDVFYGGTFIVPGDFDGNTADLTISDDRVLASSKILLFPDDEAARLSKVVVTNIQDGSFDITAIGDPFTFAACSVGQEAGSIPGGIAAPGAILNFDTVNLNNNWNPDTILDRVISNVTTALVQVSLSISGQYATGRTYNFGVNLFNSGGTLLGTFDITTSTSNQNDVISVGGSVLVPNVQIGDYFEITAVATGATTAFNYDMTVGFSTMEPLRNFNLEVDQRFNYLNIVPTLGFLQDFYDPLSDHPDWTTRFDGTPPPSSIARWDRDIVISNGPPNSVIGHISSFLGINTTNASIGSFLNINPTSESSFQLAVRHNVNSNDFIGARARGSIIDFYERIGGVFTLLGETPHNSSNDLIELDAIGDQARVLINGSVVMQATTLILTPGVVGIVHRSDTADRVLGRSYRAAVI